MIDLTATGPAYRGHKLAHIISAMDAGKNGAYWDRVLTNMAQERKPADGSTLGYARLSNAAYGNVWGLSVSDVYNVEFGDGLA